MRNALRFGPSCLPGILALGLVAVLMSARALAAEWVWQQPCAGSPSASCTLWLNHPDTLPNITVKQDTRLLASEFVPFARSGTPSASVWYVDVNGLDRPQLKALEDALQATGRAFKPHQRNALYLAAPDLMGVVTLDQPAAAFVAAAEDLRVQGAARAAIQLETIIQILGGNPHARRTVFWLDSDFDVSQGEIDRLRTVLQRENARMVAVRLMRGEVDRNQRPAVATLAAATNGLYLEALPNGWPGVLETLASYSDNGGELRFPAPAACGPQTITFEAQNGSGSRVSTEWTGEFRACPAAPAAPAAAPVPSAPPPPVEVADPAPAPEPAAPAPAEPAATPAADASSAAPPPQSSPTPAAGAGTAAQQGTEPASTEAPAAPAPAPAEGSCIAGIGSGCDQPIDRKLLFGGVAASLGVLLLALFLIRRKRKAAAPRFFGYLIEARADGEHRHRLDRAAVRIGRNRACDIVLQDDTVSDMHAVIRLSRDGSVVIVDLNSLNGTQVNGVRQQQAALIGGELVEIGATRLRFERGG
jgi:hypothetical protein